MHVGPSSGGYREKWLPSALASWAQTRLLFYARLDGGRRDYWALRAIRSEGWVVLAIGDLKASNLGHGTGELLVGAGTLDGWSKDRSLWIVVARIEK